MISSMQRITDRRMRYFGKVFCLFAFSLVLFVLGFQYVYPKSSSVSVGKKFDKMPSSEVEESKKAATSEIGALKKQILQGTETRVTAQNKKNSLENFVAPAAASLAETAAVHLKERLVHLDLKGAPPTVSYLQQLFPFLKAAGATGVLMEYEDMFPYEGRLEILRSGNAYTKENLKAILEAARANSLKVVPLVQTFGHMEWVLKHKQFAELREILRYPQVLCPSNPKSLPLVKEMVDQVVALHPNIDTFHIGADEAYYVATECARCREAAAKSGKDRLMLKHVSSTAKYVGEQHHISRVLMWHDMFRSTEDSLLSEFSMEKLVEPVVWGYWEDLLGDHYFPPGMFERFGGVFRRLWAGSAFKGANGASQTFINTTHYLRNHLSWLKLVHLLQRQTDRSQFSGIILTGWQRFDHFGALCELIPVGLPSLAVNLQLMLAGTYQPAVWDNANKILGCPGGSTYGAGKFAVGLGCKFPGSEVFDLVEELRLVRKAYDKLDNSEMKTGWLNPYSLQHNDGKVFFAEKIFNQSQEIIRNLTSVGQELKEKMRPFFFEDTINEWLFDNVQAFISKLKQLAGQASEIAKLTDYSKRPLKIDKLDF